MKSRPLRAVNFKAPRLLRYSAITVVLLLSVSPSWAADYFDPSFLGLTGDNPNVDLSVFAEAGGVAEGEYIVSVYMNGEPTGQSTVLFTRNAQGNIVPDLTPAYLAELGVNVTGIPDLKVLPPSEPIENLADYIPEATTHFNLAKLRLDISVPQIAMKTQIRGQVAPSLLEDGIPAILSNYTISAGQTKSTPRQGQASRNNTLFASFRSGLNAGAWRLRSTFTHSYSDYSRGGSQSKSQFDTTTVSRGIMALRSDLVMGESYTGSDVFDSVPFRGVQLKSSEEMLPDQLRGFAPIISGIANSNARVTVRQNGNLVYETYVAPGPFSFSDLQQNGMSGDYDVTITEADGAQRQFVVPYSSLAVMLRPGGWKYEVTGGQYDGHMTDGSRRAKFILGTGAYGFAHNYTLYGGVLASEDYQSFSLGTGVSLGYAGALSTDVTTSTSKFANGDKKEGQSYRVRYSKSLLSTGTSVDLTALRYSTEHFYNFSEFNSQGYSLDAVLSPWTLERRRNSFQTSLSQSFDRWGTLNFRANRDDYWGSSKTLTGMSVGYTNSFKQINYSMNYTIDRLKDPNGNWPENRQVSVNVSIPFSIFGTPSMEMVSTYVSTSITHDNHGRTQNYVGVSGMVPSSDVSYSVAQSWGNQGQVSNSNVNLGYQGSKGSLNGGYSYSSETQTANINMSGGFLVHRGGLTLSRTLGDSVALIYAPGASGVRLSSGNGVTDRWGYAIAPYLSNYKRNNIGIDPTTLPEGVDVTQSNVNVYPTKGAVVKVKFATRIGHQVLMNLALNQSVVPFGAIATLVNSASEDDNAPQETISSIVGDAGQVYLTGLPETGMLTVKWGNNPDQQCVANFDLTHLKGEGNTGLAEANAQCRQASTAATIVEARYSTTPSTRKTIVLTPASAAVSAPKPRWLLK